MAETRKLAAILAADVVGYSRLAGADEDRTLSRLRGLRSDLIDPAIAVHHGRVVKRTGDGSLIEFRSVVDAVRCAIEVQNGMVERNAGLPPERRIEFRVDDLVDAGANKLSVQFLDLFEAEHDPKQPDFRRGRVVGDTRGNDLGISSTRANNSARSRQSRAKENEFSTRGACSFPRRCPATVAIRMDHSKPVSRKSGSSVSEVTTAQVKFDSCNGSPPSRAPMTSSFT